MKIVQPETTLMFVTPNADELIEAAGRTCYKSEGKAFPGSAAPFCASLIKRQHLSVLEHATATFRFICDRGVTHELVRHRIVSFSQESTRYCNYGGSGITLIHPRGLSQEQLARREAHFWAVQELYDAELAEGLAPQIARGVLPTCLKTEIVVTCNFREWLHIFSLRTSAKAHPQIKEIMDEAQRILADFYPVIFGPIR